ncbi:MAG TPA: thiamine-phosphate kinase [Burkholderiales bacterium]
MNEFELIRRFFDRPAKNAVQGVGDDCARLLLDRGMELAVTTDMLVEGRHFLPDAAPRTLGHKALAVNLSDLAACGAAPRWITLAIGLKSADEPWLGEFCEGLFSLAERFGVELVGGDTTRSERLTIAITALGEVPRGQALSRAGARPGDDVWVSGELGGAALGLLHPELPQAAKRLHEPQPRVALGIGLRGVASAAIDVSDGLVGDLGHVLERSGVGARLRYDAIPRAAAFERLGDRELESDCVLSGGDDYELLFTAPAERRAAIEALAGGMHLAVSRIGAIEARGDLQVLDPSGKPMRFKGGFDHFARR